MSAFRSWRGVLALGLCCFSFSASGLHAQESEETPPPPPSSGGAGYPDGIKGVKSWYPRFTGLPFQNTDRGTIFFAGQEYEARTLLVTFFTSTSKGRAAEDTSRFRTEDVRESEDLKSYYLTLADGKDLFPAADAYNDLPEVQSASLVLAARQDGVDSSPLGPVTAVYQPQSMFPGDVDGNFKVEIADVIHILHMAVALVATDVPSLANSRADVNRNGAVDAADAVLALRLVVGKGLPVPYGYSG